ncbi:hypothetical protein FB45DRAFT_915472 [Roridomyces roridus]|uniref:MYND-type domain-containing protein n=1 Tax=Roridomyces roridus TaxID=1738132 RepID=A0AAD7FKV5_9AGAR|nr:hypothetical protein FB45DRAFT_915472 [Roridomyces roridus]
MSDSDCFQCSKKDDAATFQRCSRCKEAVYCSVDCQKAHWKAHKLSCIAEGVVRGMIMACDSDSHSPNYLFRETDIDASHPIHTRGVICPVSVKAGLPIIIYRHLQQNPLTMGFNPGLDNQRATYLMIDPTTPRWQQGVGSVTVMRQDGKPLTRASIETIWMYHDRILDVFGDDHSSAHAMMNPNAFLRFCRTYKRDNAQCKDMPVPL